MNTRIISYGTVLLGLVLGGCSSHVEASPRGETVVAMVRGCTGSAPAELPAAPPVEHVVGMCR